MTTQFTENLESARSFLRLYAKHGRQAFLRVLEAQARIQVQAVAGDLKRANSRLLTMVSGLLSVLFVDRQKEIIRHQIALSEDFLACPNGDEKIKLFLTSIDTFLGDHEHKQALESFSGRVLFHLTTCSLAEIQHMTVGSLAESFDFHPVAFSRKFKAETDLSPQKALTEEKLKRAWFMIKSGEWASVKQVAKKLGFFDAEYFSGVFKTRFGILPSQVEPTTELP